MEVKVAMWTWTGHIMVNMALGSKASRKWLESDISLSPQLNELSRTYTHNVHCACNRILMDINKSVYMSVN
jgi:hypothetical protein